MKKRLKISLDTHLLNVIIPGAYMLDFLPRKRKKALKKFVAKRLIEIAEDEILVGEVFRKLELAKNC